MGIKRDEEESRGQANSTDAQKKHKSGDGVASDCQQELAFWTEIRGQDGLRFEVSGGLLRSSFRSFVEEGSEKDVVGFFRAIARELEEKRGVLDFHLKVRERKQWFCVEVYFGDGTQAGPEDVEPGECISCFPGAALFPGKEPGVTAGECVLKEFSDQPHVQCSLDAKARTGFVITPVRHLERMSDMQDDELFALWSTAVRALRHDSVPFRTMILNHGTYRNTPHLHLKVWIEEELHQEVRLKWSSEKLDLWNRLLAMVEITPKTPCRFFQQRGYCRYGEKCRYSHVKQDPEV